MSGNGVSHAGYAIGRKTLARSIEIDAIPTRWELLADLPRTRVERYRRAEGPSSRPAVAAALQHWSDGRPRPTDGAEAWPAETAVAGRAAAVVFAPSTLRPRGGEAGGSGRQRRCIRWVLSRSFARVARPRHLSRFSAMDGALPPRDDVVTRRGADPHVRRPGRSSPLPAAAGARWLGRADHAPSRRRACTAPVAVQHVRQGTRGGHHRDV